MANRMNSFPAEAGPERRRYPWADWTDGTPWMVTPGEDFDTDLDQFRNRLYTIAKRKDLRVRTAKVTEDGEDHLAFQFFGHPDPNL